MTTLIKDALIYDGSGGDPVSADILMRGKHITKIGMFARDYADRCIDARGTIVTPGFIDISPDINTHLALLHDATQSEILEEGITTIIGGGEGISAAPVFHNSFSVLREHTTHSPINADWSSFSEFLIHLEKQTLGINVGQCVGYTTIRGGIAHRDRRDLVHSEIRMIDEIVTQSFRDGAFGISIKLGKGVAPEPSHNELVALGKTVAKNNRVFSIHPRDNAHDMYDVVKNIINVAQDTNANIEVNHLLPLSHIAKNYSALAELLSLKAAMSNVHFDVPIHRTHEIPIHALLPEWAHEEHIEVTVRQLNERNVRDRVLNHLSKELAQRKLIVCRSAHPQMASVEGKSIEDIAILRGTSESKVLLDIMVASSLRATVIDASIDMEIFQKLVTHAHSLFSTTPILSSRTANNQLGTFLKKCKKDSWCPTGVAIAKMTALPAQKYRIANRGMIRAGYYADIVLLEDFKVRDVFVNGSHVVEKGSSTNIHSGVVLRASKQ